MAAAQRAKTSEVQSICRKLTTLLKKRYKTSLPKTDRPILEMILYAVCLENTSAKQADAVYGRLESSFQDLNEIRVSSISELAEVFGDLEDPERRALRVRSVLHYIFEKHFVFEFETLRRKTLELANKQLEKIKELSPFVRAYTLQTALGGHIIPVDNQTCHAAVWLGLVAPHSTAQQVSDTLKSALRKSDAPLFCHLLRELATDPDVNKAFAPHRGRLPEGGHNLQEAPARLAELFQQADARAKRQPAQKRAAIKKAATKKKSSPKSTVARRKVSPTAAPKKTTRKKHATGRKKEASVRQSPQHRANSAPQTCRSARPGCHGKAKPGLVLPLENG